MNEGMKRVLAASIFAADPRVQQLARTRGELRGVHPEGLLRIVGRAWDLGKANPTSEEGTLRREAEARAEEVARMGDAILLESGNSRGEKKIYGRRPPVDSPPATSFYVDTKKGDDDAPATAERPLRTFAELARRFSRMKLHGVITVNWIRSLQDSPTASTPPPGATSPFQDRCFSIHSSRSYPRVNRRGENLDEVVDRRTKTQSGNVDLYTRCRCCGEKHYRHTYDAAATHDLLVAVRDGRGHHMHVRVPVSLPEISDDVFIISSLAKRGR